MPSLPILDNHIHLQPSGMNVKAVVEFQKAGGTHLIVSHLPHKGHKIKRYEDFKGQYDITLNMAELAREKSGVKIFVTLGPYPVELLRLSERMQLDSAIEIMMKGMEIAAEYVREGKAIALGEIGRPHFLVDMAFVRPDGIPVVVLSFWANYKSGKVKLDSDAVDHAWVTEKQAKKYDLISGIYEEIVMADKIINGADPKKVRFKPIKE